MTSKATSKARATVNKYTASPLIALSAFVFLSVVNFLPSASGVPVLALLVAVGLGLAALRRPHWASIMLALFAFATIGWQLLGFGLLDVVKTPNGLLTLGLMAFLFVLEVVSARIEPSSMALAVMAVALMLTPFYYLSIALIVAAAAVGGLESIGPVSITFVSTLLPLLLLENGIYFSPTDPSTHVPVIFSYLKLLHDNMAPSLSGLNVPLVFPFNIYSPYAAQVSQYIPSPYSTYLIVPVILLGIVFSASASVAGIVATSLSKLGAFEKFRQLVKVLSPLAAGLVTAVTFVVLITTLAPASAGDYQTSLATNSIDMILLLAGALGVGLIFTVREYFIQRLERLEFARNDLASLLTKNKELMEEASNAIQTIASGAPTVSVRSEKLAVDECSSLMADIVRGVGTASYQTVVDWTAQLQGKVLPSLDKMPENLRIKVINELTTLSALASTHNNMLEEARAEGRFPTLDNIDGLLSLHAAVDSYKELTKGIRDAASELFTQYTAVITAYNFITDRQDLTPPVNASYLFDSGEYVTGMRLVSEEYWLNFRSTSKQELEGKVKELTAKVRELGALLDGERRGRLEVELEKLSPAEPAFSPDYAVALGAISVYLQEATYNWRKESEQLERLIRSLTPGATKVIRFESIDQSTRLQALSRELSAGRPTFGSLSKFVEEVVSVLSDLQEKRRVDEQNLILLSQYPIARKVLEAAAGKRREVPISDLPFQREASIVYIRLYMLTHRKVSFNYSDEVMVVKNA